MNVPAFPRPLSHLGSEVSGDQSGMDLLDYFAAHAPAEPQAWFSPVMVTERPKPCFENQAAAIRGSSSAQNIDELRAWDRAYERERYLQWPYAWAVEQVSRRVRQMR